MPEEKRRAIRLVQGHVGYGVHEFFPQPARYVTLVRDPVTRIASHYGWVLRMRDHYLHDEVVRRRMSLLDYASSEISFELENGQTRLLAGPDDALVEPTREALDSAKRHLSEHFVLGGLTERFDETLLLLRQLLGWRSVLFDRVNVAPASARNPVTPEAAEAIRERNRLDIELYDFCRTLFEERIAAQGARFDRELQIFRFQNALYDTAVSSARRVVRRLRPRR